MNSLALCYLKVLSSQGLQCWSGCPACKLGSQQQAALPFLGAQSCSATLASYFLHWSSSPVIWMLWKEVTLPALFQYRKTAARLILLLSVLCGYPLSMPLLQAPELRLSLLNLAAAQSGAQQTMPSASVLHFKAPKLSHLLSTTVSLQAQ